MIICISGEIGSGKTTLRKLLAEKLGFVGYSVSDYLKHLVENQGNDPHNRRTLQNAGKECIQKGFDSFVADFLRFTEEKDNIIIDGVRHIEFYRELVEQCATTKIYLIALIVDQPEREKRIQQRQGYVDEDASSNDIAEGNFARICQEADFCINTTHLTDMETVCHIVDKFHNTDIGIAIDELKRKIKKFNDTRGWSDAQNALNVAMSISIEASELLENFQWLDRENAHKRAIENCENIKEELADIIIYCINFTIAYNYDLSTLVLEKLRKNGIKYAEKNHQ